MFSTKPISKDELPKPNSNRSNYDRRTCGDRNSAYINLIYSFLAQDDTSLWEITTDLDGKEIANAQRAKSIKIVLDGHLRHNWSEICEVELPDTPYYVATRGNRVFISKEEF